MHNVYLVEIGTVVGGGFTAHWSAQEMTLADLVNTNQEVVE